MPNNEELSLEPPEDPRACIECDGTLIPNDDGAECPECGAVVIDF